MLTSYSKALQSIAHQVVENSEVKLNLRNAFRMSGRTICSVSVFLIAPIAFAICYVVHKVITRETLSVPAGREDDFNFEFGTLASRKTGFELNIGTCVDRLAVFFSTLTLARTTVLTTSPK